MNNLGQFTLWLELIAIFVSLVSYLVLCFKKDHAPAKKVARLGFVVFSICTTVASILLMDLILNHDFRYSYVAEYSSRDLPLEYLISSFWAGQEGSFLLWVLLGSWLGILLMFKAKDMEPQVMVIYNLNNTFLAILLIKQSPFELLTFLPPDGQGLNMLLQDPWMVIHPPVVFLGYAAFTIPFAYAVAALWRKEYDLWIRAALPWTAFSFVSLGAGIIIGGYWSYKVLGWGGYWGWDPVENASLLPWLAGIALLHGMILQLVRRKLRKTNLLLAALSFILIIYCTFLTRSGVLADFSVHSFVDLGITGWLVLFMFAFLAIFLCFFIARFKDIPVSKKGEGLSYFSREFGFIAAMVILCLSTVITGIGTSAPLITGVEVLEKASKALTEFYAYLNIDLRIAILVLALLAIVPRFLWGKNSFWRPLPKYISLTCVIVAMIIALLNGYPAKASKVSTEFYTNTNLPIALLMLLLLSFVPLLVWGKNSFSKFARKLTWALIGVVVAGGITLLNGYPDLGVPLLSLWVIFLALLAGAAACTNLFLAAKLIRKRITISSGAVAHLGVGLMFLGIVSSSAYDRSEKVLLSQDAVQNAMGYEMKLRDTTFSREGKGVRLHLPVDVKKGSVEFIARPDIFSERSRDGQVKRFSHPHIRRGLISDLYISPLDYLPGKKGTDSGKHIVLQKDNEVKFHDYKLKFESFDVSAMMGRKDARHMSVGANIVVSYKGEGSVGLKPMMIVGKKDDPSSRVKLPGPENAYLTLVSIDAGAKTIHVDYDGPASPKHIEKPPSLIAEVSIKPGMTMLWLGTILILTGGAIAVVRRLPK